MASSSLTLQLFSPKTLNNPFSPKRFSTLRSPNLLKPSTIKIKNKRILTVHCSSSSVAPSDRAISAVTYLLPFFNGLQYGRYLFFKYPNLGLLFEPIFPLVNLYRSIPYSGFVAFFALYLGLARNPRFSRFVRFNAMQALAMDVGLVVPLLVQRVWNPYSGLGYRVVKMSYGSIFVGLGFCVLYCLGFCVLGKKPVLPVVGEAADQQL